MSNPSLNPSRHAEYLYDATGAPANRSSFVGWSDGHLAAIGSTSSLSCDPASDGFSITNSYVRGLNGEQVSETNGAGQWYHTNVFANGQLLATYGASETFFALNNWLGTKRAEVTPDGDLTTFASLPFGDDLTTATIVGTQPDATEQHYTGKELDSRSGNDYSVARFYANSVGRWLTPDPSGLSYADPTNPQSMNLYSYVEGNPLVFIDPSGLWLVLKCSADTESDTESDTPSGHVVEVHADLGKCSVIDDGRGRYNGFIPQAPGGQTNFVPNSGPTVPKNPCVCQGRALPPSAYAQAGKYVNGNLFNFALDVHYGWGTGQYLDAQPLTTVPDTWNAAAYGNYVYGVYMQAAGFSPSTTLRGAEGYAATKTYPAGTPMQPPYPGLPAANAQNIMNGYNAQASGTTCQATTPAPPPPPGQ